MKSYLTICVMSLTLISGAVFAQAKKDDLLLTLRTMLKHQNIPTEAVSLVIKEIGSDDNIVSLNAHTPKNPASVMKLLPSLAALDTLSPAFTWHTDVFTRGQVVNNVLKGDLYIKGGGDPFLTIESFWLLLKQIRYQGIHKIEGDVILDQELFDIGQFDRAAFDKKPSRIYNGPASALMLNFWATHFLAKPNSTGVSLTAHPPSSALTLINKIQLTKEKCIAKNREITYSFIQQKNKTLATFRGKLSNKCKAWSVTRAAIPYLHYFIGVFDAMWKEIGGTVSGEIKFGRTAKSAVKLFEHRSGALGDIIRNMNKFSNNLMARQMMLTLGWQDDNVVATRKNSEAALGKWLKDINVPMPSLVIDNGAGLSRKAKVSASDMTALLNFAQNGRYAPEFLASLPLAAQDGSLQKRFAGEDLFGLARLKTGLLDHVRTIAGYMTTRSNKKLIVVFFINHENTHLGNGTAAQDALLRWAFEL